MDKSTLVFERAPGATAISPEAMNVVTNSELYEKPRYGTKKDGGIRPRKRRKIPEPDREYLRLGLGDGQ
jgi:hypothetical protein